MDRAASVPYPEMEIRPLHDHVDLLLRDPRQVDLEAHPAPCPPDSKGTARVESCRGILLAEESPPERRQRRDPDHLARAERDARAAFGLLEGCSRALDAVCSSL